MAALESFTLDSFTTARLRATCFRPTDLAILCELHHDPRVMATLGGVRSDEQTAQFLREKIEHWERYGFGYWIFREKATDSFVGRGGLQHVKVGGNEEIEVGYTVTAAHWGKGYATEMARAMVDLGFQELGLREIVCFTLTTNRASERVMQKVGFHFEREVVHEGAPHVLYRLRCTEHGTSEQPATAEKDCGDRQRGPSE